MMMSLFERANRHLSRDRETESVVSMIQTNLKELPGFFATKMQAGCKRGQSFTLLILWSEVGL